MSSAGIQKLFCGIYSTFKCSFDEFVGEKVFSPSYSSAILAPPLYGHTLESIKNEQKKVSVKQYYPKEKRLIYITEASYLVPV